MNYTDEKIVKKARIYFSEELDLTVWENVEKYLKEIADFVNRELDTLN